MNRPQSSLIEALLGVMGRRKAQCRAHASIPWVPEVFHARFGVPTTGGGQVGAESIVMRTDEKLRVRYGYPPPPAHSPQLTVHSHVFSLTVRMHEE